MPEIGNIIDHWNLRQETLASDSWEAQRAWILGRTVDEAMGL